MKARAKDELSRDVYLALIRASEIHAGKMTEFFKGHGLTQTQYNVLRILRGAGQDGLPCQMIGERLINRVPDVTRLLDRMEREGLVRRERSTEDRRVVLAYLETKGSSLVNSLDDPVLTFHRDQFRGLTRDELAALESHLSSLASAPSAG